MTAKFIKHQTYLDLVTNNDYYFIGAHKNGYYFMDMYGYETSFSFDYSHKNMSGYGS